MVFKVLVCDPISKEGITVYEQAEDVEVVENTGLAEEEICKIIPEFDAIIVRSQTKVTAKIIEAGSKLKVIGRAGVGLDNVDKEAATRRGVVVMNVPGGNTVSTAELTFAMLLALSRNIPQAHASLLEGKWDRKKYKGVEVRGKVLGILGMGRIGTEVAKRARAFEMKVLAFDPYLTEEKARDTGVALVSFDDLLGKSDFLTIHTPLNVETRNLNLINAETLAKMKKGSRIINCARGGIVDEKALAKALDSGHIAGAAFDVYPVEPPEERAVIDQACTVCTPHLGASTQEAQDVVAVELAYQVVDALQGKGIRNAVNIPYVDPELIEKLGPYIQLGEKLGLLGAQLSMSPLKSIEVDYMGEVTEYDVRPITVAILKGALQPYLDVQVNYVNAPYIARERGITLAEVKSSEIKAYTTLVAVKLVSERRETHLWGTLFAARKDPRVVRIDGYHVDMRPFGRQIICKNEDKPGFIGSIGTLLGNAGVNIADMTVGRQEKGTTAITVIAVDEPIEGQLLEEIQALEHLEKFCLVNLDL